MNGTIHTVGTGKWYGPVAGIVLAGTMSALPSPIFRVSDQSSPPHRLR